MQIISLNNSTVNYLENIAPKVFDNALKPSSVEAFIECPQHVMLLAIDDCLVIGMVSGVEYFHPDKPPQFWINEIAVTPDRQNEGIGRLLISEIISLAKERGCIYAWLGTEMTNASANRCFSQIPNGDGSQKFVLYEWQLAEQKKAT